MIKLKLSLVMLLLCLFAGGMKASYLHVSQGTDVLGTVPFAGYNFNKKCRSQYVIPAANLQDLVGSGIYCLMYYLTDVNNGKMPAGNVKVHIKEVNYTTMTQIEQVSDSDMVYYGPMTLEEKYQNVMLITFNKPYLYKGGNLLIDFEKPEAGKNNDQLAKTFYGTKQNYASGLMELPDLKLTSEVEFIPQTTLLYYSKPNIRGIITTPTSATIGWDGESEKYDLRFSEMSFFEDFEDGFDRWIVNHYGATNTAEESNWHLNKNNYNHGSYQGDYSIMVWSWYGGTAYNIDSWLISPEVELGDTLKYWVRSGDAKYPENYNIYISTFEKDETGKTVVTDRTDTTKYVLLASPGAAPGTWTEVCVDLSAYKGKRGYIAFRDKSKDMFNLLIDNIGIYLNTSKVNVVNGAESPYTFKDLNEDHQYMVEVCGLREDNKLETTWTQGGMITHGNPTPNYINVNEASHEATISWTGFSDSYQFAYRKAEHNTILLQDFEEGYKDWRLVNCQKVGINTNDNAHMQKYCGLAFNSDQVYEPQYFISPRMPRTTEGTTLSFYYRNYNKTYPESFMVGYSSTTDDIDAFTFGDTITISDQQWKLFNENVPVGTKYICIKYVSKDKWFFFIDDIEVYKLQESTDFQTIGDILSPSITLNGLEANTQYDFALLGVKNRKRGKSTTDLTEIRSFLTQPTLQLANDDAALTKKNIDIIAENDTRTVEVTLTDRTLLKNGDWNTLCLPFGMTKGQIAASPLAGATIKALDNSDEGTSLSSEGTLTLKFNSVNDIEAGKPYLVKWETPGSNISDPVFSGVTISSSTPTPITSNDQNVVFVGQYSPFEIVESGATGDNQGNKNEIILMSSGNKLGYSKNPRTIANGKALKCFRAHFYVPTNDGQQANSFVLDFGNGDETTGIIDHSAITVHSESGDWYTIEGVKLGKMPTKQGVYVVNGNKVVIK